MGKVESAVDIAFFGIFVVVLLNNGLLLFNPQGLLLKKYIFAFPSTPVSVCTTHDSIIVTGENADISNFQIDIV